MNALEAMVEIVTCLTFRESDGNLCETRETVSFWEAIKRMARDITGPGRADYAGSSGFASGAKMFSVWTFISECERRPYAEYHTSHESAARFLAELARSASGPIEGSERMRWTMFHLFRAAGGEPYCGGLRAYPGVALDDFIVAVESWMEQPEPRAKSFIEIIREYDLLKV